MRPVLFEIGGVEIYGYGLMLGLAFAAAAGLLARELERKRMSPGLVAPTLLLALTLGLVGGKAAHLLEHRDSLRRPGDLLSLAGLSFLGGFLLAALGILVYLRLRRVSFLRFADAAAPGLMLAYGIARIGCQLAGDGDYGTPTDLPWGMSYPQGLVPTLETVHPTPVYETLVSFALFGVLWHRRRRPTPDGHLFCLYLVLSSTERFLVEMVRRNPDWFLGLTQAQALSLLLAASGLAGLLRLRTGR